MIDTISDVELEREYLTSKLLAKVSLPKDYIKIRLLLSSIPVLDSSEFMPIIYSKLISTCLDKLGLVKDEVAQKFYNGNDLELLEELLAAKQNAEMLIPILETRIMNMMEEAILKLSHINQQGGFLGMTKLVQTLSFDSVVQHNYDKLKFQMQKMVAIIDNLISLYGSGSEKVSLKNKKVIFDKKYQLYLQSLATNLEQYVNDINMSATIGNAIGAIAALNPKNSLDPFTKHLEENLLKVLVNPEDYYKDCAKGEIISPIIGQMFYQVYPFFYKKFFSMFLDEVDGLPYKKQIQFRRGFGVPADDSLISQVCASTMIAQPIGA